MYHYTGATIGLDWGRFNGGAVGAARNGRAFNVTDDAGHPIPYRVAVDLSVDHRPFCSPSSRRPAATRPATSTGTAR